MRSAPVTPVWRRSARHDCARRYPFEPFLPRVWDLRENVTVHDAWYVALAEALHAPLVTADERLRADGPRCEVLSPGEAVADR